ncbi:MAG: beta-lactamase family protein [Firmicutes bacterium]|nr:beta-lactamase family protein [Bacillota bacterium]
MVFPHKEFEKASCRDANIEKGLLADMFDFIEKEKLDIHSMILLKDGAKVFDAYAPGYYRYHNEEIYSISKSFTSVAIGICQDKGLLKVDDFILSFFKDSVKEPTPGYEKITIKHLLTMSVGQEKDILQDLSPKDDAIDKFFHVNLVHEPGTVFMYNNSATFILSAIVTKVTRKSTNDFLAEVLYPILEIEKPVWDSFDGISMGAFGMKLNTIDMAKFGLLLVNDGLWKDTQVVSKAYLDEAGKSHISTKNWDNPRDQYGYGYQFWMNDFGDYRAAGWLKQYIVINKRFNVVFVTQAKEEKELLDLFSNFILPALEKGWLYDNVSLREYIRKFEGRHHE